MTEAEFLEQLDAWALGALAADERAAMEAYVAAHPAQRAAVRRAFTTAAALSEALPPSPPSPGTWGRLAAALPDRGTAAAGGPRRRPWGALGWALAAAAAALALWLWFDRDGLATERGRLRQQVAELERQAADGRGLGDTVVAAQARLDGCKRELDGLRARDALASEAVALLELAGTQLVPLEPAASTAAQIAANAIYHRGVKKAYIVVKGLGDAPGGYQIWVNRAGRRLPAGALAVSASGGVIASVSADTLDDVPESFEVTQASGELVLRSRIKI